jgi:nucleotide-binding universal stress UspA family protein
MKHILCGYDGSEQAEKAFQFALNLAEKFKARLTVLAVIQLHEPAEAVETRAILENSTRHYQRLFQHLKQNAALHSSLAFDCKTIVGSPAEQIVQTAEQLGVDHIVMGHRGKTAFHRWLIGSVAKQVLIYAHCAITIIR